MAEAQELRADLTDSETDIAGLISDSGDGSGDDIVDIGSKTFEREQDMFVAAQVEESLRQIARAIARIDDGTYGVCEVRPTDRPRAAGGLPTRDAVHGLQVGGRWLTRSRKHPRPGRRSGDRPSGWWR